MQPSIVLSTVKAGLHSGRPDANPFERERSFDGIMLLERECPSVIERERSLNGLTSFVLDLSMVLLPSHDPVPVLPNVFSTIATWMFPPTAVFSPQTITLP
jgi:hypothetical protein